MKNPTKGKRKEQRERTQVGGVIERAKRALRNVF
jgi:hypothetical protein